MGRSHSKMKLPNNPLEKFEYNLRQKQKELEKRKKRHEKVKKELKKGKKFKHVVGNGVSGRGDNDEQMGPRKCDLRMSDYDTMATNRLRHQISFDFSSFVLNQLILSMQFYGNYEREKQEAIDRNFKRESDRNRNLEKHSIILPNVIDDMVERRFHFRAKHGMFKNEPSSLQMQTMYVVHENIEILKPDETNYASISPTCKVVLDTQNLKSENWKGYVRLKLWELIKKQPNVRLEKRRRRKTKLTKNRPNRNSIETTSSDEHESSEDSDLRSQPSTNGHHLSRSSSSTITYPSSSEYDYAYITNLNTHRPLSLLTATSYESTEASSSGIPGWCISDLPTYLDYNSSDTEDHTHNEFASDKIKYLNSKAFLCYFAKHLKDRLALDLGIPHKDIEDATWRGASIYTANHEIIPAIFCPWPSCAFEWKRRQRPIHENPLTGQKFQWPNQAMVHRIVSFGCHVIPLGYAPKRGKNPFRELEWKIVFPKAERYLESCLTNTQVKVFMISKALVKTFIEPQLRKDIYMFSFDHLRAHLFWQCEKNYAAWPEEYIGEVLIRFLQSFLDAISVKRLRDYFLPERNLFENIPEKAQVDLHQIISQILQNPVMHIMMAYRNIHALQYFCPKLQYNELYSIIVVENPIGVINKATRSAKANKVLEKIMKSGRNSSDDDDNDDDSEDETDKLQGLIGYSQKREKFDETKRRRTKKLKRKERAKIRKKLEAEKARRQSMESIDLQFIVPESLEKIQRSQTKIQLRKTLDDLRRTFIIDLFTTFFIASAKNAYGNHALDQTTIYINQAERLCSILKDFSYQKDTIKKHADGIEQIREAVKVTMKNESESGPELPRRISLEPGRNRQRNGQVDPYTNIETATIRHEKLKDEPTTKNQFSGRRKSVQFIESSFVEPRDLFNTSSQINTPSISPSGTFGSRRKSVQFIESSFIEPREFFTTVAQVHSSSSSSLEKKGWKVAKSKLNGIIKQRSHDESITAHKETNGLQFKPAKVKPHHSEIQICGNSEDDCFGDSTEL